MEDKSQQREFKKERNDEILALAEEGLTLEEIGEVFGITRERVRQIIQTRGRSITEFHKDRLVSMNMYQCNACDRIFAAPNASKFCSKKCLTHFRGIHGKYRNRKAVYLGKRNGRSYYRPRARFNMEKHLGRKLKTTEFVLHKNGDIFDDRIENLEIMSRAEHSSMVAKRFNEKIKPLEVQYLGKIYIKKSVAKTLR